eukprot:3600396-Alexandrium_andersonii.AAC.1
MPASQRRQAFTTPRRKQHRRQSRLSPQSLFAPGTWAIGSCWNMPESSSEGRASSGFQTPYPPARHAVDRRER